MQQHSADATVMPGARFVDPSILSRIGNLELLARTVVDGFINGLHRAPYFGASIDFAEHRGYVAGDDIRRVDWRLYARTDRYYIKQYEADTNANFCVILDVSKSMSFGSKGVTKLEYASYLGACLAYLAHKQRDRVGIITFDNEVVNYVPPSAKHFDVLLHTLDRATAGRRGDLSALKDMAQHFKRRTIIVLLSDFYEDPVGGARSRQAAALPRQRPDCIPRPRPRRARLRLRRRVELRGSRKRRADSRRPAVVRGRVSPADSEPHRVAEGEVFGASGRLHAGEHRRSRLDKALFAAICPHESG